MQRTGSNAVVATRPEDVHQLLAAHFNKGDLEALVALYEPGATLVPQPGLRATGAPALRDALAGFLAFKPRDTFVETLSVVLADDCALTRSRWGLKGIHPQDGSLVTLEHYGVEIMRRQLDGTWRFAVDDPFGGDRPTNQA